MIRHVLIALLCLSPTLGFSQISEEDAAAMVNARYANGIAAIVEEEI